MYEVETLKTCVWSPRDPPNSARPSADDTEKVSSAKSETTGRQGGSSEKAEKANSEKAKDLQTKTVS